MNIDTILWLILLAILLPSIGFGMSVIAGGQGRRHNPPPGTIPGHKNIKRRRHGK
jgi:hypothetical protein